MGCAVSPSALWILLAASCGLLWACGGDEEPGGGQGGTATGSPTGWGGAVVGGSHQGAGGTGSAGAAGSSGGQVYCEDAFRGEPNDGPDEAVNLLVVSDDNPDPWPSFDGVILDAGDVDWYTYLGTDDLGAYVDPEQAFEPTSTDLQLCAYFWCTDPAVWGPPEIGASGGGGGFAHSCPLGTEPDVLDLSSVEFGGELMGEAPGCCTTPGTGTFHLGEDLLSTFWAPFGCPGLTDDMKVFLRVGAHRGADPPVCRGYVVRYHF